MKPIKFQHGIILLILAGALVFCIWYGMGNNAGYQHLSGLSVLKGPAVSGNQVILDAELPSVPEKVLVYHVIENTTRDTVASFAGNLGIHAAVTVGYSGFICRDDGGELNVNAKTGSLIYHSLFHTDPGLGDESTQLPGDEESVKIASNFIRGQGFWSDEIVLLDVRGMDNGGPLTEYTDRNGTVLARYGWKSVHFGRVVNGLPTGDEMTISIAGDRSVAYFSRSWRIIESYKEYTIISPEIAADTLLKENKIGGTSDNPVKITDVRLEYNSEAPGVELEYLVPIYTFTGELREGNSTHPVYGYVPAVPELGFGTK